MWMYATMFAIGYIASIYSWPQIRTWFSGEFAEAVALRKKAADLEANLRGKL